MLLYQHALLVCILGFRSHQPQMSNILFILLYILIYCTTYFTTLGTAYICDILAEFSPLFSSQLVHYSSKCTGISDSFYITNSWTLQGQYWCKQHQTFPVKLWNSELLNMRRKSKIFMLNFFIFILQNNTGYNNLDVHTHLVVDKITLSD